MKSFFQKLKTNLHRVLFMEAHVYAVWKFMCVVKELQRRFSHVEGLFWYPVEKPEATRLLNEIILSEESDLGPDGKAARHFRLSMQAMDEAGASTQSISTFLGHLRVNGDLDTVFEAAHTPPFIQEFVGQTLYCLGRSNHELASAFLYGKEALIPTMFRSIVRGSTLKSMSETRLFLFYLERHMEGDGESHDPLATRLMHDLCAENSAHLHLWAGNSEYLHQCAGNSAYLQEAFLAGNHALRARERLWNPIEKSVDTLSPT